MTTPISIQLYSVREEAKVDWHKTIEKIASIGYFGVETAGFPEHISPKEAGQLFRDLGLIVNSAHAPLPIGENKNQVLETMDAIHCDHLVCPWMDPKYYESEKGIRELAALFNEAAMTLKENDIKFSFHNHWFEMQPLDGKPAYQALLKLLNPEINFQIDTYWVKVAGLDPVIVVKELGARAPLLHIKDGPGNREEPMTAVGKGVMDIPAVIEAGKPHTEWVVVELDRCATDMMTAVKESYQYLVGNNLARGNK